MDYNNIRTKVAKRILPKVSHSIGRREQLSALISPQEHYAIALYTNGARDEDLSCFTFDKNNELVISRFLTGKVPQAGERIKLDIFLPGLTSGANYGVFNMPVVEVKKNGNLLEAVVNTEDMKANAIKRIK